MPTTAPPPETTDELKEAVAAVEPVSVGEEGSGAVWPDESAEAAFLAEARDRGEVVAPAKAKEDVADDVDTKALPSLDTLVQRIPANVRESLEDLFRARFVSVKRVPKKALKT